MGREFIENVGWVSTGIDTMSEFHLRKHCHAQAFLLQELSLALRHGRYLGDEGTKALLGEVERVLQEGGFAQDRR